jgi:hypothetical protein
MATLFVDKIDPQSGTSLEIGSSGDTITIPSGASLTIPNGGLSGQNYPAFEAHSDASQSVSDGVITKVEFETEVYDTDSMYDNATNYRFTPTVAGKYFVYAGVSGYAGGSADLISSDVLVYKNGSLYRQNYHNMTGNPGFLYGTPISLVMEMNGSTDYVEIYGRIDEVSGGAGSFFSGNNYFGAYRIGS